MTEVKISAACARLLFTDCGPACIEQNGCKGNCCDAPSRPSGCMVTVHESERELVESFGVDTADGFIQPRPGTKGCPFKKEGLCILHDIGAKPFGCIASPFTLNKSGTLIIRNRYKMLPCYRGGGEKAPAYRVFRSSLEVIFGKAWTADIIAHFDSGGGDVVVPARPEAYAMLRDNDEAKRRLKEEAA